MQELRLVAVSEDGTYAVLAVPGRGGRFSLPIDDRLRTVARGQFSRLAQYEIEVENPLRPKEIQDRIRAGETADEIADAAGIPIERVRRFEGPVLAEREYRAQEAQRSTVRGHTESGPGPRLGEVVIERLADAGAPADALAWDSRKRTDGNWQVQLQFTVDGRPQVAEWIFDPRRRHVIPADDLARRLCLPQADWPAARVGALGAGSATVTPIGSRLAAHHGEPRAEPDRLAARGAHAAPLAAPGLAGARQAPEPLRSGDPAAGYAQAREVGLGRGAAQAREAEREIPLEYETAPGQGGSGRARDADRTAAQAGTATHPSAQPSAAGTTAVTTGAVTTGAGPAVTSAATAGHDLTASSAEGSAQAGDAAADAETDRLAEPESPAKPARKSASGKARRASVPSWDEIMLGNSRQPD